MKWLIATALLTTPVAAQAQDSPGAAQAHLKMLVEAHWRPIANVRFEVSGSGCRTHMVRVVRGTANPDGTTARGYRYINDWDWRTARIDAPTNSQITVRDGDGRNLVFEMDGSPSANRAYEAMARLARYCRGDSGSFTRPIAPEPPGARQMVKQTRVVHGYTLTTCVSPRKTITLFPEGGADFLSHGLSPNFTTSRIYFQWRNGRTVNRDIWLIGQFRTQRIERFQYLLDGKPAGSSITEQKRDPPSEGGGYSPVVQSGPILPDLADAMRTAKRMTVIALAGAREIARADFDVSEFRVYRWLVENGRKCQ